VAYATESKLLGVLSFDFVTNTTNVTFSDNYVTYEAYVIPAAIVATNDTVCIYECCILAYCIFIANNDATGAQLFFVKMSRNNGFMSFYEMITDDYESDVYISAMTYVSGRVYYAGKFEDQTAGLSLGYYSQQADKFIAYTYQGVDSSAPAYLSGIVAIPQSSQSPLLFASGSQYDGDANSPLIASFWEYQCESCAPIALFSGYTETSATLLDPITQVIYILSSNTGNIIGCILKHRSYPDGIVDH
jgi:hypothetical protein